LGDRLLTLTYRLGHEQGAAAAWLYQHGEVVSRRDEDAYSALTVRLAPEEVERFEQRYGVAVIQESNQEAKLSHG
jgi:GTP-binding protein HflX